MLLKSFDPKLVLSHTLSLYFPSDLWPLTFPLKESQESLFPMYTPQRNFLPLYLPFCCKVAYGCCEQFRAKQRETIVRKKGTSPEFGHWFGPSLTRKREEWFLSYGMRFMWPYTTFLPLEVATAVKGGSENLSFLREHIECMESCVP